MEEVYVCVSVCVCVCVYELSAFYWKRINQFHV